MIENKNWKQDVKTRGWSYQSVHNHIKFYELGGSISKSSRQHEEQNSVVSFFSKFVEYLQAHEDLQIRLNQQLKAFEEKEDQFENAAPQLDLQYFSFYLRFF